MRGVGAVGAGVVAAPLLTSCQSATAPVANFRLTARPGVPTVEPTVGLSPLGLGLGRDGSLYVPPTYDPSSPAPLFVALHGAGGSAANWVSYPGRADAGGFVFLAPDSRGSTWDLLVGSIGPDVAFLDLALAHTFDRCRIDATRVCIGGFSDGATYVLALGLGNGDLFTNVVAYSPGFLPVPDVRVGHPGVFVSHGLFDPVLSVQTTREVIVPELVRLGYDVTLRLFDGQHEVPSAISDAALDWFLTGDNAPSERSANEVRGHH